MIFRIFNLRRLFLLALIGLLIYFAYGYFTKEKVDTSNVNEVTVPNFIGMSRDEVEERINEYDFTINYYDKDFRDDVPVGEIYHQDPPANVTIKAGSAIMLYVSAGTQPETVPDIFPGTSFEEAKKKLENKGFVVIKEDLPYDNRYRLDVVVEIYPVAGTALKKGSEVTVFVNSRENYNILMPNVIGLNSTDALDRLVSAGFRRSNIETAFVNSMMDEGQVLATSLSEGEMYSPDTKIALTVSNGYKDVEICFDLPEIDDPVDLNFYVDGKFSRSLSEKFEGIVPKKVLAAKNNIITVDETLERYTVSVAIALAGTNHFYEYLSIEVNGKTGACVVINKQDVQLKHHTETTTTQTVPHLED